jgi:hypothetical protein
MTEDIFSLHLTHEVLVLVFMYETAMLQNHSIHLIPPIICFKVNAKCPSFPNLVVIIYLK